MADLGGISMAEVSQGLKDALLDPALSRVAAPNAGNPLATVADVLAHASGGGSGVDFAAVASTSGNISVPNTNTAVLVPGTQVTPNLSISGIVVINFSFVMSSTGAPTNVGLEAGVRIDGVDHWIDSFRIVNGGSGDNTTVVPMSGSKPIFLAAGPHVIQAIARSSQTGTWSAEANVTHTANLSVIFKTLQGGGSGNGGAALVKVEAETSGAPGSTVTNATQVYAVIPNTLVSFTLTEAKTVFFTGMANALRNGASRTNVQIGLRVDGIDYNGQAPLVAAASFVDSGLMVTKALDLAPGPHTAQLIFKMADPTSSNAIVYTSAEFPARLTGIYTAPVFGIGSFTKQEAIGTSGSFATGSGTFVPVPNTSMVITLSQTQTVFFSGYASTSYYPPASNRRDTQLGLRITAAGPVVTDYAGSWDNSSGLGYYEGETVVVSRAVTLPAGTYTAELVVRTLGFVAVINNDPTTPSVLTALYTQPQQLEAPLFTKILTASKVDGSVILSDTGGAWADMPGPMAALTYDLVFTPTITGKAEVTVSGTFRTGDGFLSLGLKVNGADVLPAGLDADGETPHGFVASGENIGFSQFHNFSISFTVPIDVTSGVPTTVRLRYQSRVLTSSNKVFATAGNPLNMSVKYR